MIKNRTLTAVIGALTVIGCTLFTAARAQVGQGLIDPNIAAEKELVALPHMTPAIVKAMLEKRPFMSATELNAFLLGQKLTPQQAEDFYRKAFVHVNLNT